MTIHIMCIFDGRHGFFHKLTLVAIYLEPKKTHMNKYYDIPLFIIVLTVILIMNACKSQTKTTTLGQEMADATEMEKKRIEAGNLLPSPLPGFDYSKWPGEQSLINPAENELDLKIYQLCTAFKTYDADKRKKVRNSLSQDNIYTLLEFTKRATIFCIRKKDQSYISNGFIAIAMIDAERCDYRDVLVTLSFLNHGLQKLNLVQDSIVQKTVGFSDGKTKKLTEDFFQRSENNRRIEETAGYTAIETSKGISFIETGYEKYTPKHNLAKSLLDISDYVYSDKYLKGEVAIGENIPSIWLSAENDSKIEKALSGTSGTAKLSTQLRNNFSPKSGMQMLLIYLSEFNDNKSQQILLEQLDKTSPTAFKRINFVQDNILCVIVQRATMVNLEDFESQESLKRFEKPIRELIQKIK
jgi:hypothetical protein